MPQTPKSVSANILGSGTPAAAIYTVPAATTAVVKTALGVNTVGGSSQFTIQKQTGGLNYPLILNQTPTITPATGGTAFNSRNLLDGPVTLGAGDSILASDGATPQFRFPQTSDAFATYTGTFVSRAQRFSNSIYLMTGYDSANGSSFVLRSTDAVTWTEIATGNRLPSSSSYFISNIGNTWVIGAFASTSYIYSTDNALTWTAGTLPSNANIFCTDANSTTFVFATGIGLYTSTNGSTWTLNTAYNTYLNATPANDQYSPQFVEWNGTYWFISTRDGAVFSTDLSTYTALYSYGGGGRRTTTFWGVTWSPAYSRYYTTNKFPAVADLIVSSTNGFTWSTTNTGFNTFNNNGNGGVACAGTNPVLIARAQTAANILKSTNGTTWTSTTDIRGFQGMIRGMDNGFFISTQSSGISGQAYITTDPATSTGTLMSPGIGSNAIWSDAASNGTGWVAVYYHASTNDGYCAYGPNGTTVTDVNGFIDSFTSGYGIVRGVLWWAAAGVYIAWTTTGYFYYSTNGASWSVSNAYNPYAQSSSNVKYVAVGTNLYATSSNNTGYFTSLSSTNYTSSSPGWTYTAVTSSLYSTPSNGYAMTSCPQFGGLTNNGGALATNGTDILFSNGFGGIAVYTPSVFRNQFRTPGTGGLTVERVNNLDVVYTGAVPGGGNTNGFYYSSNVATTLPTAQGGTGNTGEPFSINYSSSSPASSNPNMFNMCNFFGGTYYFVVAAGSSTQIAYGPDLRGLVSRAWAGNSLGGVQAVNFVAGNNSQTPIVSDGTTFVTYQNQGNNQIRTWKGNPATALASSVITLSVVEVS